MSLFESGEGSGDISLRALFDGEEAAAPASRLVVGDIADLLVRGGWPGLISVLASDALVLHGDYLDQLAEIEVPEVADGFRDPGKVRRLLASLGRNTATEVAVVELARDAAGAEGQLEEATVGRYLDALDRLMIVENQPAWSVHLRSRATLRKAPKRHLVDPSLAVAAIGGSADGLVNDPQAFGQLFESMAVRDLRVFADPIGGGVFHYRDSYGIEADAVVQLRDGRWAGFEIKLSEYRVDEAANSLLRFADVVDTTRVGEPSFLAVIVATGPGYVRADGVCVIPIGALGP